ncbi:MAG: type IV pili twitching motility protein PilT [Candidatus Schekmanbacteria bacterium RBG_13_48_7]|uniref:Type IV pili twitching motility protein PilT n=1 Tax=Candidatus Schekmanbacteria bacterium RBG_13_48_7 TaxID=1817878 RepID=A0A1F7RZH1_9BACT|nr:MAG: type IV pili twitching motility protein PilT [Candidatus Schekmanbacteria bacterium RBG_13_48_7]
MNFKEYLTNLCRENVSDIHFKVGSPPMIRVSGKLSKLNAPTMLPTDTMMVAKEILSENDLKRLDGPGEIDTSYTIPGVSRFRANIFKQRGSISIILRIVPFQIPSLESLGLPPVLENIAMEKNGLILVTGATGTGKSSTLTALIDKINSTKEAHILTIEDPIEYLHKDKKSSINQREIGMDSENFLSALRAALRQDPDVILIGEMRDTETIATAIKAAETGILVMSTLHTVDVAKTINRILDSFPPIQQQQVRFQLAANLRLVISQRLLPRLDGVGRVAAVEIMRSTMSIQEAIIEPEKTSSIKDLIEAGREQYNMQSFDQHLAVLYQNKIISRKTAVAHSSNPADFERSLMYE